MSPNNPTQDKKPKHQSTEHMKYYLWAKAEKMKAESDAKRQETLEKENFRSAYLSKYQQAVSETQSRFVVESKRCGEIFKLIEPTLREIINFAEQHSIFPPKIEKTPDLLPIQIFYNVITPRIEPNLSLYYSPTNDEIVAKYQNQTATLMQEHVYLDCGINWGLVEDGESYGNIYGIQLTVHYAGEIRLGGVSFSISELESKEFRMALSEAFYDPSRLRIAYPNPSLSKNVTSKQESTAPIYKKLVINIAAFFRRVKNFWIALWSGPQFEIDQKTPLLKKIWYGFPIKDKPDDES